MLFVNFTSCKVKETERDFSEIHPTVLDFHTFFSKWSHYQEYSLKPRTHRRERSMQLRSIFAQLRFLLRQQIIKSTSRA